MYMYPARGKIIRARVESNLFPETASSRTESSGMRTTAKYSKDWPEPMGSSSTISVPVAACRNSSGSA
jgi:hypothetical protein